MLQITQCLIATLTLCNAFQGNFNRFTVKSSMQMTSNDEKNVPKLARDDMIQPMQKGSCNLRLLSEHKA
jgi:hypothetical protein